MATPDTASAAALRVFVSSRMAELAAERAAVKAKLAELGIEAFVFEDDAGARSQAIRDTYLDEIEAADLYLGLFWRGYGAYTVEEFDHAQALGLDCLVYEKHDGSPREPALQAFLDRIGQVESGTITPDRFSSTDELLRRLVPAVERWHAGYDTERRRRVAEAVYHGVPGRPTTAFVGRDEALAGAAARLRAGEDVAIEGLAGAGKTTLATALVQHRGVQRRYRDGVLWASLGPQADAGGVLLGWAQALDRSGALVRELAQAPGLSAQTERFRELIADRVLLLVIDDAWESDAALALHCGGPRSAHLLSTRDKDVARAFLRGAGALTLHELDEATALRLLQQLAPEACAANEAAARGLVRAVGGLPQALRLVGGQLAGAQAGLFAEVFPELGDETFAHLADPAERLRSVVERIGGRALTLQETVLMSLQGLTEPARQAFFALGAFAPKPERFDADAAQQVCGQEARALAQLAARHLLEVDTASRGLALHATVADVARQRVPAQAVVAHREHLLARARAAGAEWQAVEPVYGQLRWAWRQAPDDATLFEFMRALERFQLRRGLYADRLAWAERCRPVVETLALGPAVAVQLEQLIGDLQGLLGLHEAAVVSRERQRELSDAVGDPAARVEARLSLGGALNFARRHADAHAVLAEARALARESGDARREAEGLALEAAVLRNQGRLDEALERVTQALSRFRAIGDRPNEADMLALAGSIHMRAERQDRALEQLEQALALRGALGHDEAQAELYTGMAQLHLGAGRIGQALEAAQQAVAGAESSGDLHRLIEAVAKLGDVHVRAGETDTGLAAYARCLALAEAAASSGAIADAHENMAWALARAGRDADALTALRKALAVYRQARNQPREAYTLGAMALRHASLGEPEAQVRSLAEAADLWRALGDGVELARALDALVLVPRWQIDAVRQQRALDSALAALRLQPADAAEALRVLQQRRADVERYGVALWLHAPHAPAIAVDYGRESVPQAALRREIEAVRDGLRLTFGWPLPWVVLAEDASALAPDEVRLSLFDVPRRQFKVDPADAARSAARGLAALLRQHLADFVGHQEVIDLLQMQMPDAAHRLQAEPVTLSGLVAVLRTLIDERVPVLELPAIVRRFLAMWPQQGDRLAVVDAVRRMDAVRPMLPGNQPGTRLIEAGARWERLIADSVRVSDAMPYLGTPPDDTMRCLAAVRAALPGDGEFALFVEDAGVRRYLRKLVELEWPWLPVIARDELVVPAEGRVIGSLAW